MADLEIPFAKLELKLETVPDEQDEIERLSARAKEL